MLFAYFILTDNVLICFILSFRFDFCAEQHEKRPSENLGQVLFGERIELSPYKVCQIAFLELKH